MILLTGATGTVGSELARLLSAKGIKFRAYSRNPKKAEDLKLPGMEVCMGDMADSRALDEAMKGVDRVFLLSSPDPRQAELQGNVIRAAKRAGVSLIVKQSAFGAGPDSPVALARWHYETERELRDSGVPYCILRPMMFMQGLFMHANAIKSEGVLRVPMKKAKVSLIDARDIAKCAAVILTGTGHEGKIYELTGPEAVDYERIAEALSDVCGKHVRYEDTTLEEAEKGMIRAGLPEWLAEDIRGLFAIFSSGGAARIRPTVLDITGEPARSIEEFCHDFAPVFHGELVHH
ncbi:MAG: SDR family oxidoreductase [Nitrospinae bacterium]|nr:SDR family oxidoreductase [Nitrospinota bacterium]